MRCNLRIFRRILQKRVVDKQQWLTLATLQMLSPLVILRKLHAIIHSVRKLKRHIINA